MGLFHEPKTRMNWNYAGDDWHCPKAENVLEVGKSFNYTMAAKNGEMSFDFTGIYTEIELFSKISYVLADDRKIHIT
ncbi:SRPBCC domain-containing protein, partial [Flavobacterium sp. I-STPA6A]|uniref:SRPBCC domain-containing protein n=1 Tax=Flavobacterium sp. I-STPA6A TaxID=2590450 RepID=UPI0018EF17D8